MLSFCDGRLRAMTSRDRRAAIRTGIHVEQISNGYDIEEKLSSLSSLIPLTKILHKNQRPLATISRSGPRKNICLDDKVLDDLDFIVCPICGCLIKCSFNEKEAKVL